MKRVALVLSILFISGLAVFAMIQPAKSLSTGITNYSGNPIYNGGQACNSCHATGETPVVEIEGPEHLLAGETAVYTLTVQSAVPMTQTHAGLNVSVTGGVLDSVNADTSVQFGEITHSAPKPNDVSGLASFAFSWTAPITPTTYIIYGAGNSVNRNFIPSGDAHNTDVLTITVSTPLYLYLPLIDAANE